MHINNIEKTIFENQQNDPIITLKSVRLVVIQAYQDMNKIVHPPSGMKESNFTDNGFYIQFRNFHAFLATIQKEISQVIDCEDHTLSATTTSRLDASRPSQV